MFENRLIKNIHASRYIMSWVRVGGTFTRNGLKQYDDFRNWLESLSLNLSDEEVNDIVYLAQNGKMELEISAKTFIENMNKQNKKES
jgi:hypothetical protein